MPSKKKRQHKYDEVDIFTPQMLKQLRGRRRVGVLFFGVGRGEIFHIFAHTGLTFRQRFNPQQSQTVPTKYASWLLQSTWTCCQTPLPSQYS